MTLQRRSTEVGLAAARGTWMGRVQGRVARGGLARATVQSGLSGRVPSVYQDLIGAGRLGELSA
jgi:hypothetical protein